MLDVRRVATVVFLAWCANDLEELLTMAPTSRDSLGRLPPGRFVPDAVRERGLSQTHVNLGIAIMGGVVASACVAGVATRGRSAWFRGGLLAFGVHGFGHIAMSVRVRGYTSGVLTSPTVVIPAWLWSRRRLAAHGLSDHDASALIATAAALATVPATHAVTYAILGVKGQRDLPVGGQETSL